MSNPNTTSKILLIYLIITFPNHRLMEEMAESQQWLINAQQRPVVVSSKTATTTTLIRTHKCQLRKPIKMRDLRVINRRHSEDNWRPLMTVATDARNKPDPVALLMTAIFLNAQKLLALRRSQALRKLYYYHHGDQFLSLEAVTIMTKHQFSPGYYFK